jgi:hypothetical protein
VYHTPQSSLAVAAGRHTIHGQWPPRRIPPKQVVLSWLDQPVFVPMPSIALYGILSFMARMELSQMEIPDWLPRTRAEAAALGVHRLSAEHIAGFNENCRIRFHEASQDRNVGEPGWAMSSSVLAAGPTFEPHLPSYVLGALDGNWVGSYAVSFSAKHDLVLRSAHALLFSTILRIITAQCFSSEQHRSASRMYCADQSISHSGNISPARLHSPFPFHTTKTDSRTGGSLTNVGGKKAGYVWARQQDEKCRSLIEFIARTMLSSQISTARGLPSTRRTSPTAVQTATRGRKFRRQRR